MGRLPNQVTDFHMTLTRERARADRTEQEFSVLVLEGQGVRQTPMDVDLIQMLDRRLRDTDVIGWFDKQRIGTLLPETPSNGAVKVAHDIRRMTTPSSPTVTVYTYPGQWLPEDIAANRPIAGGSGSSTGLFVGAPEVLFDDGMPLWKRILDIVGAVTGIVILFPLFVIVGATIAIVSPGPLFLRQTRIGYQGRPFTIWKFRTMKAGSDTAMHQAHFEKLMAEDARLTKLDAKGDPRIIPLGRFIRRSCLDELPQLFNVLAGTMSLVGPRPCLDFAVAQYRPWQRRRCDAVPGMTGLWQVSGKNRTTFQEMLRLDIAYVQQKSLALDLSIILRTLPAVLRDLLDACATDKTESIASSATRTALRAVNEEGKT